MMERSYLIAGLIGWFCAKEADIDGIDLKIKIDQVLSDSGFTLLGIEKDDLQLFDEMIAEFLISVMGRKFNRQDRRENH